jgi:hypothetical protein
MHEMTSNQRMNVGSVHRLSRRSGKWVGWARNRVPRQPSDALDQGVNVFALTTRRFLVKVTPPTLFEEQSRAQSGNFIKDGLASEPSILQCLGSFGDGVGTTFSIVGVIAQRELSHGRVPSRASFWNRELPIHWSGVYVGNRSTCSDRRP